MIPLIVAGVTYEYPQTGDGGWGDQATAWAVAITNKALFSSGGLFNLTADVNFGPNFGILSKYFSSISSNISLTGQVRLAHSDFIGFRNNANSADLALGVNSSDQLTFNGANFLTTLGALAPNIVLVTNGSSVISPSSTTTTQLSFLDATSSIQTQLNGKQASGSYLTALTGDVAATGPGSASSTIQTNVVSNTKLAQTPADTLKGNNTGSPANVADLTVAQVRTMLGVVAPTTQKFLSGSGTYTTPANILYLKVQAVGGGGGGGGSGSGSGSGGAGGNTTFGVVTAGFGGGGSTAGTNPGTGGAANLGGAQGFGVNGTRGGVGDTTGPSGNSTLSGYGGNSYFGGGGSAFFTSGIGIDGVANTGGGGGAAFSAIGDPGSSGGGAGAYIEAIFPSPSATYSYSVGAGGTVGASGTGGNTGGAGGSGIIIVTEYYQ
jgi:hypothetical protein